MPLLDHFHPPLSPDHQWESFHSAWPTLITQQLNHGVLPPGYFAAPHTRLGAEVEIDAAAFERTGEAAADGAGTAVYAPPRPRLAGPLTFRQPDLFEVQVMKREGRARLVAAIELISPSNKDRARHRQAFVVKCASYLQQGVSAVLVDIVTERSANLYAELLDYLEQPGEDDLKEADRLYAASYRPGQEGGQGRLEVWAERLSIGVPLPVLPLWLGPDLPVRLDLETSYEATCTLLLLHP